MPKNSAINSILVIGSGPIIIGQACEFDYSGTQACLALREEGYKVILVNPNPATIMTDPDISDVTYIQPICWDVLANIIDKEKPDAILPTMGGQIALNCCIDLEKKGLLKKYNIKLLGADINTIETAEDREKFRSVMQEINVNVNPSITVKSLDKAYDLSNTVAFPVVIRSSYTLSGNGSGIANDVKEYKNICLKAFSSSPGNSIQIEACLTGWKEFELEVMRDKLDNVVIICSIENIDPMGIHTGDSITVAPALTLTDKEYQKMRNTTIRIMKKVGVETGGANVQFAVNPKTGEQVVVEMNPRVSRSSALASKATGVPIAKIAAKLAIGYTLSELRNEITDNKIPASFEPTIDYIVIKFPYFNFDKFPGENYYLTTSMKSIGETMGIGRNFQTSLQKAIQSLDIGKSGLDSIVNLNSKSAMDRIIYNLKNPSWNRIWYLADAIRIGLSHADIHNYTHIDPWFIKKIDEILKIESCLKHTAIANINHTHMQEAKKIGLSDERLAKLLKVSSTDIYKLRKKLQVKPVYKHIDSCAAEFPSSTGYLYSSYETNCESEPSNTKKILVIGSGPNKIGQGIEFDYCCVHALFALREVGFEAIIVNNNPETVSTDHTISDRLYFEPLTFEYVYNIIELEKPEGVIIQFGGQTALSLVNQLHIHGVNILGTSARTIINVENRGYFTKIINQLNLKQPKYLTLSTAAIKDDMISLKFPVIVRPSFVIGGSKMKKIFNKNDLHDYLQTVQISEECPLLIDEFIEDAIELDIEIISDGSDILIAGILEHIEPAGVHSGDSTCYFPPVKISDYHLRMVEEQAKKIARHLKIIGLANIQIAIQDNSIYILEVNPRASRCIPYLSKALGISLTKIATLCQAGVSLSEQGIKSFAQLKYQTVKMPISPLSRFTSCETTLEAEMKSTGEVMGIGNSAGEALLQALKSHDYPIKKNGRIIIQVQKPDEFRSLEILMTTTLPSYLKWTLYIKDTSCLGNLIRSQENLEIIHDIDQILDIVSKKEVCIIINLKKQTTNTESIEDKKLRYEAKLNSIHYLTSLDSTLAFIKAITSESSKLISIQEAYQLNLSDTSNLPN